MPGVAAASERKRVFVVNRYSSLAKSANIFHNGVLIVRCLPRYIALHCAALKESVSRCRIEINIFYFRGQCPILYGRAYSLIVSCACGLARRWYKAWIRERERERERERGAKKGLKRKESRERRESMKHNVDRGKGNNRKEQHLWRRVHNFVSYCRSGGTNDAHLYW